MTSLDPCYYFSKRKFVQIFQFTESLQVKKVLVGRPCYYLHTDEFLISTSCRTLRAMVFLVWLWSECIALIFFLVSDFHFECLELWLTVFFSCLDSIQLLSLFEFLAFADFIVSPFSSLPILNMIIVLNFQSKCLIKMNVLQILQVHLFFSSYIQLKLVTFIKIPSLYYNGLVTNV